MNNVIFTQNKGSQKGYGQPILPKKLSSERYANILRSSNAFNQAKASASYGIVATINYGFILPLKEKIFGLDAKEKINLDLYEKHTALCSGIEKVQKVYKSYSAAKETADKATSKKESREARHLAIAEGRSLDTEYKELIKLAISQADAKGFDKTDYLEDLHNVLEKKTLGQIYNTVHMMCPKEIESSLLRGTKESIKDNLQLSYLNFVTNFVGNLQESLLKTGSAPEDSSLITDAFIQGLATIPELGELDNGLILIEFYDELTKLQEKGVAGNQKDVITYFSRQIEILMNQAEPITNEDVQKIQYKGISLLSVLPSIDVKQLNELKEARKELQAVTAEIKELQESAKKGVSYSYHEVKAFFQELSKYFEHLPKDGSILDQLYTSYLDAKEKRTDLAKQIKEVTKNQRKWIEDAREKNIKINEEIAQLGQVLEKEASVIKDKEKELKTFSSEIKAKEKKWIRNECSDSMKQCKMEIYNTKKTELQNEINGFKSARSKKVNIWEAKKNESSELEKSVKEMINQFAQIHQDLEDELDELRTGAIIQLSREESKKLSQHPALASKDLKSSIFLNSIAAHTAEIRINELTKRSLELQDQLKTSPLTLDNKGDFVLNLDIFGENEKAEITTQLEENLVMAKKITIEVGRKIVEQDKAFNEQNKAQATGSHQSTRTYNNRASPLELELDKREKQENADDLRILVNERVKKLVPVISVDYVNSDSDEDSITLESIEELHTETTVVPRINEGLQAIVLDEI